MLWHIIKKEFYQNLITARFIVGTTITIILVIVISLILINDYRIRYNAYNDHIQTNEQNFEEYYVYSEIESRAAKPPEILSIFCNGVSRKLGNVVKIQRQEVPYQASVYVTDNPLLNVFQSIDIALIFKLIFSLMAMLFAFDLFCGEKEKGTLKLMLSGTTSRTQVFTGKILGGLLSLCLTLILGILITLLIFVLSPRLLITGETILRMLFIFIVTFSYISAFFVIGALVSTLTPRSVTSLTMNLFIWVVLVIGLPNLANYTAEHLKPIESLKIINEKVNTLQDEFRGELRAYDQKNPEPAGGTVISGSTNEYGGYYKFKRANLNQFRYYQHFIPFSERLRLQYAEKIYSVRQNYFSNLKKQADFVNYFSIFSPVRLYENMIEIFARTGLGTHIDYMNQARIYRSQVLDYFSDKTVYRDTRFFSIMTEEEAPDVTSASVFQDGSEGDKIWQRSNIEWEERPYLSLDDFPRFTYHQEDILVNIQKALPLFWAMFFLVALFFAIGYFSFVKYDVR